MVIYQKTPVFWEMREWEKKEKDFKSFFLFFSSFVFLIQNLLVVIWLILPVVICLSQRLSHACLSISQIIQRNCEWLIKSVMIYMTTSITTWITVVILELIHAQKASTSEGVHLLDKSQPSVKAGFW